MPQFSRQLLAKVLGQMGAAEDGQVLAAARKASQMVREAGLTWEQALGLVSSPAPASPGGADAPVIFDKQVLTPPFGARWADSVRRLLDEGPSARHVLNEMDRHWLRAMPGRLHARAIQPHEAANLWRVWRSSHERYETLQGAQAS